MSGDSGNYSPGRESINLPPMAFDGMEAAMMSSLIPHATVFLEDLASAIAVDNAYRDAGPGDMDTLAWIKAAPRAASEVKRYWNQRLGIVGTNNLAVNILAVNESIGRDIPLDPTCTELTARLTALEDGEDFMHASQIAYQLYLEGFDADETETARVTHNGRTWIHHLYMTEMLSRIIKLGATDEQILAVTGQRSLDEGQIDFIRQQREFA